MYECMLLRIRKVPTKAELSIYLKALRKTFREERDDVRILRLRCNSEGGRSELAREFASRISQELKDPNFGFPSPESEFERQVGLFERDLATFLAAKLQLGTHDQSWTKERVPYGVLERLKSKSGTIPSDLSDHLTLGECKEIIQQKTNWEMLHVFFVGKKRFPSKDLVMYALDYVIENRNAAKHNRPPESGYSTTGLRDQFLSQLSDCMTEINIVVESPANRAPPVRPTT